VVESLAKCGAFDSLHPSRAAVWSGLDAALETGAAAARDREIGQASLFAAAGAGAPSDPELPDAPPWTERERLEREQEVLGFSVTGHPLSAVAAELARLVDTRSSQTAGKQGREVRVGGILTQLRETRTRRGALMAFGALEDPDGSFDLVIFAEPYAQHASRLKQALGGESGPTPLVVTGQLEEADPPKVLVREVLELARAEERLPTQPRLPVRADEATRDGLVARRGGLSQHRGDCEVVLHLVIPGESETLLALPSVGGVRAGPRLLAEIAGLFGRDVAELAV